MSDPTRLRILKNLTTLLAGITPANGYTHDLSGKVFRGRTIFSDNDPVPMVVILEAIEQQQAARADQPSGSGLSNTPWELLLQGFAEDDQFHPTDPAHLLMAEVKKRIATHKAENGRTRNLLDMGGKVVDLKISPGVVRPADEVSNKCYFWLKLSVHLVEDLSDPYA